MCVWQVLPQRLSQTVVVAVREDEMAGHSVLPTERRCSAVWGNGTRQAHAARDAGAPRFDMAVRGGGRGGREKGGSGGGAAREGVGAVRVAACRQGEEVRAQQAVRGAG